jgi:hypothetical protein
MDQSDHRATLIDPCLEQTGAKILKLNLRYLCCYQPMLLSTSAPFWSTMQAMLVVIAMSSSHSIEALNHAY